MSFIRNIGTLIWRRLGTRILVAEPSQVLVDTAPVDAEREMTGIRRRRTVLRRLTRPIPLVQRSCFHTAEQNQPNKCDSDDCPITKHGYLRLGAVPTLVKDTVTHQRPDLRSFTALART